MDRTRSPWFYSYKKGSKPNIWPAFKFLDNPQSEMLVRDVTEMYLIESKDYKLPQKELAQSIIFAALYGMEHEDVEQYNEWLEATATKLRAYYLAYRVIRTIQNMPVRERKLETWGINNKQPTQDKDDQMTMSIAVRDTFKDLLDGIA